MTERELSGDRSGASVHEQSQVQRALAGDALAVTWLIRHVLPAIQARTASVLLRRGRGSRADIEDLTQDTLLALLVEGRAALANWDPARGHSLRGFAAMIAERRAISQLRARRAELIDSAVLERESAKMDTRLAKAPEAEEAARGTLVALTKHMHAALSVQGLDLFYRLYVWDQSVKEVSAEANLSAEAVYQWRSRLRKVASEFLNERAHPS